MKHKLIILLALLVPASAFANSPDLCEQDVYLNMDGDLLVDSEGVTLSRYCQWAGPDVPVWADTVCCSLGTEGAVCSTSDGEGRCPTGIDGYYCEYGEQIGGGFVCYQSFPSACELGPCADIQSAENGPLEDVICCIGGTCFPWDDKLAGECGGVYMWCDSGYSKIDGTVECLD